MDMKLLYYSMFFVAKYIARLQIIYSILKILFRYPEKVMFPLPVLPAKVNEIAVSIGTRQDSGVKRPYAADTAALH